MNLLLKSSKNYKWIFVVGCYNSGTTLLSRILEQHPQIAGLPAEGQFLTGELVTPRAMGISRLWVEKEELFIFAPDEKKELAIIVRKDWKKYLKRKNAEFILEKTPTNIARLQWLQNNFPDTHFIYIIRNGYAVSLGIEKKITAKFEYKVNLLKRAAYQWERSAEIFQRDSKMLKKVIEISYEDLTKNPQKILNKITEFLQLAPMEKNTINKNYEIRDLNTKITNQNPDRLRKMTTEQKKTILSVAYKMLKYYGYDEN